MTKHLSVALVLSLAVSSNAFGEESSLNYDFSYIALLDVDIELSETSSLPEPEKIKFEFSDDDPASLKERLEGLRPKWQWSENDKHYTLTLSEDDEKYVRFRVRF